MMPLLDEQKNTQDRISSLQTKLAQNSLGRLKKQLDVKNQEVLSLNSQKEKQKKK